MNRFLIKKATVDDAFWIAYVSATTWYTSYKWLVPQKILENRIATIPERAEKTRNRIQNKKIFLVAIDTKNDKVIWMLSFGPSRNENYRDDWEIYAFYILKEYQRLGIGRRLFLAWIQEILNLWYNNMIINVLDWNDAVWFYQKFWWVVVWEKYEPCETIMIKENVLFFENIRNIK